MSKKPETNGSFCTACSGGSDSEIHKRNQEEINDLTDRVSPTDSEEKFRKHVRIRNFEDVSLEPKKSEQQEVYENDEVLYVIDTPEPQSKPSSSKTSSKISLSQTFSNFSFFNKSAKNKKALKESTICRCEEKFDMVRKQSFNLSSSSSSSSESISGHNCTACRCVNCPLKHLCWLTYF